MEFYITVLTKCMSIDRQNVHSYIDRKKIQNKFVPTASPLLSLLSIDDTIFHRGLLSNACFKIV